MQTGIGVTSPYGNTKVVVESLMQDVAKGHVAALDHLSPGFDAINLGSGKGTSVLELVHAFEKTCGIPIPYEFTPRRQVDLPEFYANPAKAESLLGWRTTLSIEDMCRDTWRWQQHTT